MKISNRNMLRIILLLSVSMFSFFVLVISVCVFVVKIGILNPEGENRFNNAFDYKYLRLNPTKNESTSGFVTLDRKLNREEYIFTKYSHDDYTLISNFGTTEYLCEGSCFCGNEENRRSVAVPVIRGLTYLVAAVSGSLAYHHAKDYFDDFCERQLSESCNSPSSIHSEIEQCLSIKHSEEIPVSQEASGVIVEEKETKNYEKEYYHCYGNCLTHYFKNVQIQEKAFKFRCHIILVLGSVGIDGVKYAGDRAIANAVARREFENAFLVDHCKDVSERKVKWFSESKNTQIEEKVILCRGTTEKEDIINPTIICER